MTNLQTIIGVIEKGGVLMYPLILFSMLALWIFLDRWICLQRARSHPEQLFASVRQGLLHHGCAHAYQQACAQPGPLAALFGAILKAAPQDKAALEELATIQARHELRRLSVRLPLLNLLAGLAPLVGLLGTVVGMVRAFQTVASAEGAVNPSMLASGIWEALLTTVAGLCVAIPALLFHHYLDQRVKSMAYQMDHYGSLLIRLLTYKEHMNA
jgi:biopolymer transport protein ExbB